jgi:glycosyltransferase involved in cell wall biosynthesis
MLKVLHIVENFNGQATEKWLFQIFKELQKGDNETDWTFYCLLDEPGKFSDKVVEQGGRVICSPITISSLIPFIRFFRKTISNGSYDVIHCHQDLMSAICLLASIGMPVGKRIVHIHNTSLSLPTQSRFKSFVFRWLFKHICIYLSDHIVGVSDDALKAFYHGSKKSKMSVIHCGIDLLPFRGNTNNTHNFRKSLDIPDDADIMLFVGRMIEYKNPCFVLDVLEQLLLNQNNVYAVFVGVGPLENDVSIMADKKSVTDRVRVLGWKNNVPQIMRSCNLLIWPGVEDPMEGLGLGVIEAQAAGLKVVMSLNVPIEAIIISEMVNVVPLSSGAKVWADTITDILRHSSLDSQEALQRIEESSFSISESALNIKLLHNS